MPHRNHAGCNRRRLVVYQRPGSRWIRWEESLGKRNIPISVLPDKAIPKPCEPAQRQFLRIQWINPHVIPRGKPRYKLGREGRGSQQARAELAGVAQPAPSGMAGTRRGPAPTPPEFFGGMGESIEREGAEAGAKLGGRHHLSMTRPGIRAGPASVPRPPAAYRAATIRGRRAAARRPAAAACARDQGQLGWPGLDQALVEGGAGLLREAGPACTAAAAGGSVRPG